MLQEKGRIKSVGPRYVWPIVAGGYTLNFDQAITAHSDWKRKLSSYLQKPNGSLKPADIALDNKCDLGKWIAGEGANFSNLTEFASLKAEHARFHKVAAAIVARADRGERVAEAALGATSECGDASFGCRASDHASEIGQFPLKDCLR